MGGSGQALLERLLRHVERSADPAACWVWVGCLSDFGHGRIRVGGKVERAHRVSYTLHHGPIPDGQVVRHRCDNPACVNPAHLELGSQQENVGDAVERGRFHFLDTKLDAEAAEEIRERLALGASVTETARLFGVHHATVSRINSGIIWASARGARTSPPHTPYNEMEAPF